MSADHPPDIAYPAPSLLAPLPSRLLVAVDRSEDPACCRLILAGELDAPGGKELRHAVAGALRRPGLRRLELNLRAVPFLDSAGIKALLVCDADAVNRNCRLVLTDLHPWVHQVLEMTGLLGHFGLGRPASR